jgi:hypothetical protein
MSYPHESLYHTLYTMLLDHIIVAISCNQLYTDFVTVLSVNDLLTSIVAASCTGMGKIEESARLDTNDDSLIPFMRVY